MEIKGVEQLYDIKPDTTICQGIAKIEKYVFDSNSLHAKLFNMRADGIFRMVDGTYIKLHVGGKLMMSDTRMERLSNMDFIYNAKGNVLIAGLGIGLIIHNIQSKIDSGEITSVTVVEKYPDVVALVAPKFPNVKIICADIFQWETKEKFDTIYFDIWPDICGDNLEEMKTLHARYRKNRNKGCWVDSWMKEYLKRHNY